MRNAVLIGAVALAITGSSTTFAQQMEREAERRPNPPTAQEDRGGWRDRWIASRLASLRVAPERLADALYSLREQAQVEEDELPGWNGIVALVDYETGQTKTITFWESDDALRRSEIRETQLRCRVVAAGSGSIASVQAYDVALNDVPVGV